MKLVKGKLILQDYHFERLFNGMELLQFKRPVHFTKSFLVDKINMLSKKNAHSNIIRVRLNVFRSNGGLYDPKDHLPNYTIETWQLADEQKLNSNGLVTGVFKDIKKSCDVFSNIKSNNFLPYTMAALYAKKNKLNDAFLFNTNNRICDSTLANIFIIKDEIIYTPPLTEGCIAGVVRRWLLENLPPSEFIIKEKTLSTEELLNADEIFITNSIRDINWVKQFHTKQFNNSAVKKIYSFLIKSMY